MGASPRKTSVPEINPETLPYWEAAREGVILIKSCRSCHKPHFYPKVICPHCGGMDTEWKRAAGKGEIYSYSVMRRADPPYVLAFVTLDEGVSMMTNIIDCDPAEVGIGLRVKVKHEVCEDGNSIPFFVPDR